jgi:hypothetical protein
MWLAALAFLLLSHPVALGSRTQPESPQVGSKWVHRSSDGKLVYHSTAAGDKIMDFSSAGYMGGGVAIPVLPVRVSVGPSGADDTALIQQALDTVAALPQTNGLRGAVLLQPGVYHCGATLRIKAGGMVLRGSGSGAGGTVLQMTGPAHLAIALGGRGSLRRLGEPVQIEDAYVPSGARSFNVREGSVFKPGETVLVLRPVTRAWIQFMGMGGLYRNGRKETWLSAGSHISAERRITQVQGKRFTLDVPLSDSLDSRYLAPPGSSVVKVAIDGRISQAGVESFQIVSPPQPVTISQPHNQGIRLRELQDAWVKDLLLIDTVNSVGVGRNTKRITVENVRVTHTVATRGAAKPADFCADGTQILFDRCSASGNNLFYFVTGARVTGPNVLLNCVFHGNGHIQPHARWATGLLVDNCHVPEGGIDFMNRGEMGSGHGWTIGWAVAWNCQARSFIIQQPPGAMNWAIGCQGAFLTSAMPFGHRAQLPPGTVDSPNTRVTPASLYLAQLAERLGSHGARAISHLCTFLK